MEQLGQHDLKAWRRQLGPLALVLFKTGWWMRPGVRWWCVRLPGTLHLRLGPLQVTYWRRR